MSWQLLHVHIIVVLPELSRADLETLLLASLP